MYEFSSALNKEKFMQGLEKTASDEAFMHIFGALTLADGTVIELDGENIVGSPAIETQILADPEVFDIAEMYVGTLEITLDIDLWETDMTGAEISLSVTVDGCPEEVPMGVWDVYSAKKQASSTIKITAYDRIAKLTAEIPRPEGTGIIRFAYVLEHIEELSGVRFAQTIEDLQALCPDVYISSIYPISMDFALTCWEEVQYLAQYLGCYVVANREGKIEFRRFALKSVRTISAEQRFNIDLSCGLYYVGGFGFTDKYGNTVTRQIAGVGTASSTIMLSQDNVFIVNYEDETAAEREYGDMLDRLAELFTTDIEKTTSWYSGTLDFFGDPTLDAGDMVRLTGGISGRRNCTFLIGHSTWQFRGPQTLISGGAPRSGTVVSVSGGGGSYGGTTIVTTKIINIVEMKAYNGQLFGELPRTAAVCRFSVDEQTAVFLTCNFGFTGSADVQVLLDGNALNIAPSGTGFLSFTLPFTVYIGTHELTVKISGNGELSQVLGHVWGQEIEAKQITIDETDWEYNIENNTSIITGYTGSAEVVEVPEKLGGKTVVKIAEESVANNGDILAVYIPDGVEAIE